MDAQKKLLLIILLLFFSALIFLFQTPVMYAIGGGQHRFINGNNVDCLSCHGNYPDAPHQVGLAGHQIAAENRNYTSYLEVGGTSYDPAGFIYTNIDSDSIGGNDIWVWDGYMWIYENQSKRYDLDFNDDGNLGGSEICKLCHNRELMRTSVQERPEHTFGPIYCNDARCHGNSNEDYRFFKTGYNTIPPASISNPVIITGNFYMNNTWTNPSEIDFNHTIFNYSNGSILTIVNSSINYLNMTVYPHYIQNISAQTVDIYNNFNETKVWFNITLPNNLPVLEPIGNKNVISGDLLLFNITAKDADNDTLVYGTNATEGIIDVSTGNYSWQTSANDSGEYIWYFDSRDDYGGVASETIIIMVSSPSVFIPPIPANLSANQGNFWINHSWQAGSGNVTDSYNVSVNDLWTNGTSIASNNSTVPPHGWSNITVYAYNNSGTGSLNSTSISQNTRVSNNIPIQSGIGDRIITAGNVLSFTVIADDIDSDPILYGTNASKGLLNQTTGDYSWSTNSTDVGTYTWYFNSSDNHGGKDTETITITVSALPIPNYLPPAPDTLTFTRGNFWIEYSWEPGIGNITDSYNLTVNGTSYTTSLTSRNDTVGPHGWSNITVYAYNNSGTGSLNSTSISRNTQVLNNIPVQDPIGSQGVTIGEQLIITVHANDTDLDTMTYSTNATDGSINPSSGIYTWTPLIGDAGTYQWSFNSSDMYGGVDKETITITVYPAPLPVPPAPENLAFTRGNFWIEYTWEPGTGNITDSYNLNVNGTPYTTSLTSRSDIVGPHGWSNITVWSYNISGGQSLNSISLSTQVQNNQPTQAAIGNKNAVEGDLIQFTVTASDADNDILTFSTDSSNGSFDSGSGVYYWQTAAGDAGQYTWLFSTMDNYGGIDTETITVTVNAAPPVSQTVTLVANSAGNTGFSAQTIGENLFSLNISNTQIDTRTLFLQANLDALSIDDTSYENRIGTGSRDAIMVVNFTLTNVQSVNWVSLRFIGAVTNSVEPLYIGLYNATSPSGGGWTGLNNVTPPNTNTYVTMLYNVSSQADKDKYLVLNGNTLTFSFAEWVNGPNNAGLSNDLYEATINYQ